MKNIDILLENLASAPLRACEIFYALITMQVQLVVAIARRINKATKARINYSALKGLTYAKLAKIFSTKFITISGFSIILIFCIINFYNIKANEKAAQNEPKLLFFHEKIFHHNNHI